MLGGGRGGPGGERARAGRRVGLQVHAQRDGGDAVRAAVLEALVSEAGKGERPAEREPVSRSRARLRPFPILARSHLSRSRCRSSTAHRFRACVSSGATSEEKASRARKRERDDAARAPLGPARHGRRERRKKLLSCTRTAIPHTLSRSGPAARSPRPSSRRAPPLVPRPRLESDARATPHECSMTERSRRRTAASRSSTRAGPSPSRRSQRARAPAHSNRRPRSAASALRSSASSYS